MSWKSPTSSDANGWTNPMYAYDENTTTYTTYSIPKKSWSPFLELSISPVILCDKIRFWVDTLTHVSITLIDVDVYYEGAWHDVYSGAFTKGEYNQQSIPDGSFAVSKARISFYNSFAFASLTGYFDEFDFNQIIVRPLVNGSLAGNSLVGKGLVR